MYGLLFLTAAITAESKKFAEKQKKRMKKSKGKTNKGKISIT